jgi:ABC-type nitrate/sulfonate/bicarbonate transport system ATPase subunit
MNELVVDDVSFHYSGQRDVLSHVTFEIETGTSVSLLAPSGSGKSTLFYLLGGLYQPTAGRLFIRGTEIDRPGLVGYMPQQSSLFPWMTVRENILLSQKLAKKTKEFSLTTWLTRAGLSDVADAYPKQLSGGMQQRVSFLRALAGGQSLLCFDEPFASLDALTRLHMQQWLAKWMNRQQTFLLITHQIEEAVLLSDKILLFPDRMQGRPLEISNPFAREERFLLRKSEQYWQFVQEIEQQLLQRG